MDAILELTKKEIRFQDRKLHHRLPSACRDCPTGDKRRLEPQAVESSRGSLGTLDARRRATSDRPFPNPREDGDDTFPSADPAPAHGPVCV